MELCPLFTKMIVSLVKENLSSASQEYILVQLFIICCFATCHFSLF